MNLSLGPADLLVMALCLLLTVGGGLWVGRGQRDMSSFLLGDRDLPWWAILGSIVATETSAATFLSVPGLAFAKDGNFNFLQLAAGYIVGRFLIVRFLLPLYFEGQLYTAYEVLDRRFGPAVKRVAAVIFLIPRNLGDGLRLYLTAIALNEAMGLPMLHCIVLLGVVTTVYTMFGGMKSVVWNDCMQFLIYIVGGLVAASVLLYDKLPGGWEQFVGFAAREGKLQLFDFTPDLTKAYTFWAGLFGGMFLTMGTHGADQMMVQRYLSARSRRDAAWALGLSGLVVFVQFAFFLMVGVMLACFYTEVQPQTIERTDRAFAIFIVRDLPRNVGLVGLVLAAVLAAALTSSLNAAAASAVNDLYLPLKKVRPSPERLLWLSRMMTVVFGAVQVVLGLLAQNLEDAVVNNAITLASFSAGLLLGIFLLGVFTRVGSRAALVGMCAALITVVALKFTTKLAGPWFAVVGSLTTVAIGWLGDPLLRFALPEPRGLESK